MAAVARSDEAACSTMALLRVAETSIGGGASGDLSPEAVESCERLERALVRERDGALHASPGASDAPAALLPLGILLARPPTGRRRDDLVLFDL